MNRSVKYTFVLALLAGCLTYGIYANNDRVCPEDVRSIALSKVEHRIERWGYESGLVFSDRAGEQGCDLSYIY